MPNIPDRTTGGGASLARHTARGGLICSLSLPAILLVAFLRPYGSPEIPPLVTGWMIASVIAVILCAISLLTRPSVMATVGLGLALLSLLLIWVGSEVA